MCVYLHPSNSSFINDYTFLNAQIKWPEVVDGGLKESKMIYHFTYLPAGLFNRLQVRLFEFSDSKCIWKRGSLLKKNNHLALVQQSK